MTDFADDVVNGDVKSQRAVAPHINKNINVTTQELLWRNQRPEGVFVFLISSYAHQNLVNCTALISH